MAQTTAIRGFNSPYAAKCEINRRFDREAVDCTRHEIGACGGCGRPLFVVLAEGELAAGYRAGAVSIRCTTCSYTRPKEA